MDGWRHSVRPAGPLVALWVQVTRADGRVQVEMQWQVLQPTPESQIASAVQPALAGQPASTTTSTTKASRAAA